MTAKTVTFDDSQYRLVPLEPTKEMMLEGSGCKHHSWDDISCSARRHRKDTYTTMLAAVPADLPGVVAHSGEPSCAVEVWNKGGSGEFKTVNGLENLPEGSKLYTHPAQDTAALQARIAELEALTDSLTNDVERWCLKCGDLEAHLRVDRQLHKELANSIYSGAMVAAQAGQEPIAHLAMWHTEDMNGRDDGFEVCEKHAEGAFPVYVAPPAPARLSLVKAALEAAAKTVHNEHLVRPTPCEGDIGYDQAIRHAVEAIRAIDPQTIIEGVGK